jgi:hypothetical protein
MGSVSWVTGFVGLESGRVRDMGAAEFEAWGGRIRVFGTRILREEWDADFAGAGWILAVFAGVYAS